MNPTIAFREGGPDDCDFVAKALTEIARLEAFPLSLPPSHDFDTQIRLWVENKLGAPASLLLIAETKDKSVGMLLGEAEWHHNPVSQWKKRAVIQALWIEPAHRRKGLARQMVDMFEDALAEHGIPYCDVAYSPNNAAAKDFWEKMGFGTAEIRARKLYDV